jgi:hypothetical protein
LYCPACAKEDFACGRTCRICHATLTQGEVCEVVTGVSVKASFLDSVFRLALQDTAWEIVLDNVHNISMALADVSLFLSSQLHYSNMKENERAHSYQKDLGLLQEKVVR